MVKMVSMKKLYKRAKRMAVNMVMMSEQWENLPHGWTKKSLRKYWNTLTDRTRAGDGGVKKCIKKIKGVYPDIDDAGAFCASLADELFPGWRKKAAEAKKWKKKG